MIKSPIWVLAIVIGSGPADGKECQSLGAPTVSSPQVDDAVKPAPAGEPAPVQTRTVLGIRGTRFTLNSKPTFLLGISYYGGLGAPDEFLRRDLDELQRHGFNWLRVWATCGLFGQDISVVGQKGHARTPSGKTQANLGGVRSTRVGG